MNRLSTEKRSMILTALYEGASVNATSRMTGVSKVTILKLLADIGPVLLDYQRKTLVNLSCTQIQCDEVWSFVGAKERNIPRDERGRGRGDAWIWAGICADTKLVPCWHVGGRDASAAYLFMEDLASRLANRVQLTTDGHRAYLSAVEGAFGWGHVDYAMLVKLYGHAPDGQRRYSPPEIIGIDTNRVMGDPRPRPGLNVVYRETESDDEDERTSAHAADERIFKEDREPQARTEPSTICTTTSCGSIRR